ncbi:MAG: hypothetical protein ACRDVN_03085 [Jiangellaceae bacterium]
MTRAFFHAAHVYRDADEYLAGTVQFLLDGLGGEDPMAAAVPEPGLRLIEGELGSAASRVWLMTWAESDAIPDGSFPASRVRLGTRTPTPACAWSASRSGPVAFDIDDLGQVRAFAVEHASRIGIVNDLTDLVRTQTGPAGTVIRLHFTVASSAPTGHDGRSKFPSTESA